MFQISNPKFQIPVTYPVRSHFELSPSYVKSRYARFPAPIVETLNPAVLYDVPNPSVIAVLVAFVFLIRIRIFCPSTSATDTPPALAAVAALAMVSVFDVRLPASVAVSNSALPASPHGVTVLPEGTSDSA